MAPKIDKSFVKIGNQSNIFLGFAGLSVVVAAFNHFSSNKNKQISSKSEKKVHSDTKGKQATGLDRRNMF